MDIKSVLFSREHLFSPFQINYKNKNLSVADKKIKTIALSIIVGIITAGIGGIILFYCLSAKYKVEKLNANNVELYKKKNQNISIKPESKRPDRSTRPATRKKAPLSKDQEFIKNFVGSFLHPYITGQITRETDPKNRKPMIEVLQEKMPGFEPSKKGEVEEMALSAFFEKAALGLYVNQQRGASSTDLTSKSPEFEILVNALTEALPREFPNIKISEQNLREKASKALDVVNEERKLAQEEAFNFQSEGD